MLCRIILYLILLIINNILCDKLGNIANELNNYFNLPIHGKYDIDYEFHNMKVTLFNIKPLISYDQRITSYDDTAQILYRNFNVTFIFDLSVAICVNKDILYHYTTNTNGNVVSDIIITKRHLIAMIKYSSFVLHELPNNAFEYVSPLFPKAEDDLHDLDMFDVFYEMSEIGYKQLFFKLFHIWEDRLIEVLNVYPPSKSDVLFHTFIKGFPRSKVIEVDCCTGRKIIKASIPSEITYTNVAVVDYYKTYYNVSFTLLFWTNRIQSVVNVVISDILVTYDTFNIGKIDDSPLVSEIVIALFSKYIKVSKG